MAEQTVKRDPASVDKGIQERAKKAAASRAITNAKIAKLPPRNKYALKQMRNAMAALQNVIDDVIDGADASAEIVVACSTINNEAAKVLFQE